MSDENYQIDNEALSETNPLYLISAVYKLCFGKEPSDTNTLVNDVTAYAESNVSAVSDTQMAVIVSIAKWLANDINGALDLAGLEPQNLPFNEEEFWMAKALSWYKNMEYSEVFDSDMPEGIADLSNKDACLLIAKCSARKALDSWRKGNTQETLLHIRESLSTLESLGNVIRSYGQSVIAKQIKKQHVKISSLQKIC